MKNLTFNLLSTIEINKKTSYIYTVLYLPMNRLEKGQYNSISLTPDVVVYSNSA